MDKTQVSFHPSIPDIHHHKIPRVPQQRAILRLKADGQDRLNDLEKIAEKVIGKIKIDGLHFEMSNLHIGQELIFTFIFNPFHNYTEEIGNERAEIKVAVLAAAEQLDAILESF
ncbi:MAG: hypothetical protein Q8P17_02155 [bacterium]|nr:hypothetical protein [bacterium]